MNTSSFSAVAFLACGVSALACGDPTDGTLTGVASAGAASGGAASGGAASGGAGNGGSSQGGSAVGGAGVGGAASGGASSGGTGAGATGATGGAASGGTSQGGSSTGGTSQGGTSQGGASQGGTSQGGSSQGGTGPIDPCAGSSCAVGQYCDPSDQQCYCLPGYTQQAGNCEPNLPGDPATHTQAQVCDVWNDGHVLTDSNPWTAGPTTCDPGTSSREGLNDAVGRINMFRWLVGVGPTWDSEARNETGRWCAVVASYNPPGVVPNPHSPPASAMCYTAEGASGTGSSNLSWGSGIAQAIDQFMQDNGNATTMGHRRWLMNPPLGPVGVGYYAGGGQYGRAQCTSVFGSSGSHPAPSWLSLPPPGFSPREMVDWTWTFHTNSSVANAQISVTRASDGMTMPFTRQTLASGYAQNTISFIPGFSSVAGETYDVEITGVQGVTISYQVKPIDC